MGQLMADRQAICMMSTLSNYEVRQFLYIRTNKKTQKNEKGKQHKLLQKLLEPTNYYKTTT